MKDKYKLFQTYLKVKKSEVFETVKRMNIISA